MTFFPTTQWGLIYFSVLMAGLACAFWNDVREWRVIGAALFVNWIATRFSVSAGVPVSVRAFFDFVTIAGLLYFSRHLSAWLVAAGFAAIIACYAVFTSQIMEIAADGLGYAQILLMAGGSIHGRFAGRSLAMGGDRRARSFGGVAAVIVRRQPARHRKSNS